MKWRSLQTMDHEHEVHRRRSALQPWLSRAEGDALPRGHLDHDGRCGRVRVVGRFPRGACPTHFLREIRFRERERALMNTSFFLSIDAIAEDAGGEGEEVCGGDTGAELIAAAAYDFLPATVDLCC